MKTNPADDAVATLCAEVGRIAKSCPATRVIAARVTTPRGGNRTLRAGMFIAESEALT